VAGILIAFSVGLLAGTCANFLWFLIADTRVVEFLARVISRRRPMGVTGIWLSTYKYPSTEAGLTYRSSRHWVVLSQYGKRVKGKSLQDPAGSQLQLDLRKDRDGFFTGHWYEKTSEDRDYSGAIQLALAPTGHRLAGRWIGYCRKGSIRDGPWTFTRYTRDVDKATKDQFETNRPLDSTKDTSRVNGQDL